MTEFKKQAAKMQMAGVAAPEAASEAPAAGGATSQLAEAPKAPAGDKPAQ
jgi:hypothetical protein